MEWEGLSTSRVLVFGVLMLDRSDIVWMSLML